MCEWIAKMSVWKNCSAELTCDVVYSILHPTKLKKYGHLIGVVFFYIIYTITLIAQAD